MEHEHTIQPTLQAAIDTVPESEADRQPAHIVGIGASAGGLEALERFFAHMPVQTGMAFVVVQHLSPDFKSLTDELLARRTSIPIKQVADGVEVERDTIYLIPPRKDMIISNGRLLLTDKDPSQLVALPIDHFFRSLAQDAGERAVGVILSGTGSDGSRGIRDIHEAGGLVVVQTAESAKFDGMPNSAQQTGTVDLTLPPEEMPNALLKYIKHPLALDRAPANEPAVVEDSGMMAIFRLLRDAYSIDFSHYKPATVVRRTERRLLLNGSISLNEYVERLTNTPEELNSLYKDLLIGVTRFFRDREAFGHLRRNLLPSLVRQAGAEDEFRVWVAGCATGEEPYSLAILLQECLDDLRRPMSVKIFATDVHRTSLEVAGAGIYPEECVSDLGPERLARFFLRKGDGYQVSPELRKLVVFAQHNVIKDAPFTKLDLISCRNLLIYLQPLAQKKVLSLFHFGLKTGGALFLGPSESPGELGDEFDVVEPRWKIYRKRRDIRLPAELRLPLVPVTQSRTIGGSLVPLATPALADNQLLSTYDTLLDEYMPPSLLVNEDRQVVQAFAGGNRYLRVRDGRFTADILELVDNELRMALTGALQRALKESKSVIYKGIRVGVAEGERLVNLTVKPILSRRSSRTHALVCLEDGNTPAAPVEPTQELDLQQASQEHLQSVEAELRYTRENLQATIEELETSNEELQATNEELVASNEELQSTNEELHSVNEELYTVNAEYQKKITELTELTADMDNLLASTQVHTLFLDRNLRIRKFTPRVAETFNLLPHDVGRRIDSFTHGIDQATLLADIEQVLQSGTPFEKQVRDQRGNWFLLRILPYRSSGAVEGVVLTLVDIGNLKKAEARAHRKNEELAGILRNSPNLVSIKDLEGRYLLVDDAFRGVVRCDPVGKMAHDLFPPQTADALAALHARVISEGRSVEAEVVIQHEDGPHTYLAVAFPLRDEDGRTTGVGGIQTDVTQLKRAENNALQAALQRERFLAMLSHELRNPLAAIINANSVIERLGPQAATTREWYAVIDRQAQHMGRLLDDLLDVARITQNKIEIRKQVVDLAATIAPSLEGVRPWLEEKRIELHTHPPDQPVLVGGDPDRLQQIQVNLLLNAAKYTPVGGRIDYHVGCEANQAVIRVRDTGVGIAPAMLERVFDPFFQLDHTFDRPNAGIGVGLTLVRSLVELHGGSVEAHSDGPGRGSEFVVRLPLRVREAPADLPSSPPPPAKAALSILLVEDEADIRHSLQVLLEHEGHHVQAVGSGPAGLALLAENCPDVALIDIGLPEMNGYDVARRVRQRCGRERPRLVALTGFGQASDRIAASEAGFDVHLTKPIKPRELLRVLAELAR